MAFFNGLSDFYYFTDKITPRITKEKQNAFFRMSFLFVFSFKLNFKTLIIKTLNIKINADSVDDNAVLTTSGNLDKAYIPQQCPIKLSISAPIKYRQHIINVWVLFFIYLKKQ